MTADATAAEKAAFRRIMRARRTVLDAEARAAAALAVRDLLVSLLPNLAIPSDAVVSGFWPIRDEIDARPTLIALAEKGLQPVLPTVTVKGAPLVFRRWRPEVALEVDAIGIPAPGAGEPELAPDLLLVPMLAFDRHGRRLGYGGGYYDRTLADLRAKRGALAIGIAYSAQEVDAVPVGPHDAPLDGIVTERDVLWFGAPLGAAPDIGLASDR